MSENPYAPPQAPPAINLGAPTDDHTRHLHLKHEASVKSIGTLYILGGIILFIAMLFTVFAPAENEKALMLPIAVFFIAIALLQLWLGASIRKLKSGARIPAIILSVIGLIGFPIGTLISAYFLYLLCCQKGKTVFSEEYARVMAATPEIKYRTSIVTWIVLLLLILLVVGVIVMSAKAA